MSSQQPKDIVVSKVIEIVSEYTTQDLTKVSPNDTFDSIGVDSLSLVEIIFDIEEAFDINIPNESEIELQGHNLSSLADILNLVHNIIASKTDA